MATEINKNNFLGSMFPNVYVKNIHLEHHHQAEKKIKNVMVSGQVFNAVQPVVNLDTPGLGNPSPITTEVTLAERLKITVKTEIYEQIDEEGKLCSLSAQGFESYINFTTVVMAATSNKSDEA